MTARNGSFLVSNRQGSRFTALGSRFSALGSRLPVSDGCRWG